MIIDPVQKKTLLEALADLRPLGPEEDEFLETDTSLLPAKKVEL